MNRILLLEDDLSLINGLSFAFKKHGFECGAARTIREADAFWAESNYVDNNTLTVYIRRLRIKVEADPGNPQMLLTVRRMGYKWNVMN